MKSRTVYVDEVPVIKALRRASVNTRKAASKVTHKHGKEVRSKAKQYVPAPGRAKYATGELQSAIRLRMRFDGLTAYISAEKDYAVFVEYSKGKGTPDSGVPDWLKRHKPRSRTKHRMKGTPFMRPAFRQVRPKYIRAMEKTIAKALFDLRIASL
jgi:HK97 gp10 family phage protein